MQIPPNGSDDSSKKIKIDKTDSKLIAKNDSVAKKPTNKTNEKTDSLNVSEVTKLIQSDLNPAKMKEERAAYVAQLKSLVQSGEYKRSSEDVSRAFLQEVLFESALTKGDTEGSDEGLL